MARSHPNRRHPLLALAVFVMLPVFANAQDLMSPAGRPDYPRGSEDATVTLIEYSSPTCGHCVTYRNEIAPRIEETYVDTGKVRTIYRPMARNAVDAAIFMLAGHGPAEDFDANVTKFYERFDDMVSAGNPKSILQEIAADIGIDNAEFEAILADESAFAPFQQLSRQAIDELGVTATPTFFVNGEKVVGGQSFEALSEILDAAIAARP